MEKNARKTSQQTNIVLISSFLGNVIHVSSHYHVEICSLTSQAFRLDQLQKKFISVGHTSSFNIQANHLNCIVHDLVEDDTTGLVNLHIVVEAESNKLWTYYVLQITTQAIKFISKFYLPYRISENDVNLTAGPRVIWLNEGNVVVYNAAEKSQKIHRNAGGDLLWSGFIGRDLVTFGRAKNMHEITDDCPQQVLMSFPNRHHFVGIVLRGESQKSSSVSTLIPDAYVEIVTAMTVKEDDTVFICTSESQLISFKDGEIQSVCQLPFKDSVKVEVVVVAGGKELVVIHSRSSEVCCVWFNTFEVAERWHGISKALIDDFCLCGSDQLLMMLNLDSNNTNIFAGFKLTDLQRYNIKDGEGADAEDGSIGSQSNLKSAVKALQTRMQVSVAAVKESKLKLADKVRMISQSHKALVNMATGKDAESTDQRASLICLYDGSSDEAPSTTCTHAVQINDNETNPSVSSPWQSLVGDQWVVGMKVDNTTSKSLHKLALSIIARDDQQYPIRLQSASNLSSLPDHQEKLFGEPLLKRMKSQPENPKPSKTALPPNDSTFVCAVTKLPVFGQPYLVCNLVLQWKAGTVDVSQPFRSICVGNVTLTAGDVANGHLQVAHQEFCGSLTDQDKITLNAVQLETMLSITSHHSSISQVASIIQNSFKFQPMSNSTGFICTASGAFSLCRIYFTILNAKNLRAQVFTSDEKTLHLLIHSLNDILPDDIIIQLTQSPGCLNVASKNALDRLEEELATKLQILTDNISSREGCKADPQSAHSMKSVKDQESKSIEEWRNEFTREQTLFRSKSSSATIEGETAKQMESEELSRKVATDTAYMELARISRI